jgi:hypothetical protein
MPWPDRGIEKRDSAIVFDRIQAECFVCILDVAGLSVSELRSRKIRSGPISVVEVAVKYDAIRKI